MAKKKPEQKRDRVPPGPPPDHLQIEGDWEDAVSYALKRGKPEEREELPTATCPTCGAVTEAKTVEREKDGRHGTAAFVCPNKHPFTQRVHL